MDRETALNRLQSTVFDVLVVGGGASGLGAAVEAAARGYTVALIEQADFAQGTSSRSTKLVHGGVRYLAQGNLSLVRSALIERGRMCANAPHLVHSRSFVIPTYARGHRLYYGVGLGLYDRLAGRWSFGRSRRLSPAETVQHLPTIRTTGLTGGVLYHDGQFDDARLAISLAQTAADHGATLLNYCTCVELRKEQGVVAGANVRDVESGSEFGVRSKTIINATGVFVDQLRGMDEPDGKPLVTVSQGAHLVLPRAFLPGDSALMVPKTADGRVLFAIPWHDRVVIGTTDTPRDAVCLEPRALPEEVAFILDHAKKYLARAPGEDDVLSVFAGLRPLVKQRGGGTTAALSRDHTIVVSDSRLITLTGGKWTTYRKMAEDVVDEAERVGNLGHRRSITTSLPVHGADKSVPALPHLRVYGSEAASIADIARVHPSLAQPLYATLPMIGAEVIWHARREMARTVEDVLARRTRSLLLDARASIAVAPAVARLLARELGRDDEWISAQVRSYTASARGWLLGNPNIPDGASHTSASKY